MKKDDALSIQDLHLYLDHRATLWNLNFQIPQGLLVGVLGPNGAGKSTLFKAILGLIPLASGKIEILGSSIDKVRKKIAYVPQKELIDPDFPITVQEVVLMGRYGQMGLFARPRKADLLAVKDALEMLGILHLASRQIGELSGGQLQRVFIARALLQEADLFLLDEPFAGIDMATEKAIMEILQKLRDEGKTILLIHHDLSTVASYFDWTILLNQRLISCGPTKVSATSEFLKIAFGHKEPLFDEASQALVKSLSGS